MNCNICGRELREDSKFCDYCGSPVPKEEKEKVEKSFNFSALYTGVFLSLMVTVLITGLASVLGFPLLFGGLFLPFLWKIKKSRG